MKTLKFVFVIIFTIVTTNIFSQDLIIKNTKDTIYCKIKDVGSEEIKYTLPDFPEDVSFGIDKEKVWKIVFSNGKEMSFMEDMKNPENYSDNKKNAIKFHLFSPLTGSISFSYERSIKPGSSIEFGLGYIYGRENYGMHNKGAIARVGYKFMKTPDFYLRNMKYSHVLKGAYVKPELIFNSFSHQQDIYNLNGTATTTNDVVSSLSIIINLGKQVIYDNAFLIDYHIGVGYGMATDEVGYYYSNFIGTSSFPIAFTAGFKIGGLF
jgi:hypothetical protein